MRPVLEVFAIAVFSCQTTVSADLSALCRRLVASLPNAMRDFDLGSATRGLMELLGVDRLWFFDRRALFRLDLASARDAMRAGR
jgi:hypothetical protein